MKIHTSHEATITEAYNGIVFVTPDGEELALSMRDGGYEFRYEGAWYEAKQGVVRRMVDEK